MKKSHNLCTLVQLFQYNCMELYEVNIYIYMCTFQYSVQHADISLLVKYETIRKLDNKIIIIIL